MCRWREPLRYIAGIERRADDIHRETFTDTLPRTLIRPAHSCYRHLYLGQALVDLE
jgi:hypothetical protein